MSRARSRAAAERQRGDVPAARLETLLDRWVAEGMITAEQAEQIHRDEASRTVHLPSSESQLARTARTPLVHEALGYLGGVLILVAAGILAGRVWPGLSLTFRLLIIGVSVALLLVSGAIVPARASAARSRLRAVLWAVSTGGLAGFLTLLASDGFDWAGADVALFAAGVTSIYAAILWSKGRHLFQQGGVLASIGATAAAATAELGHGPELLPGVAVIGIGAAWFALGWGAWFGHRRPTYLMAAMMAVFGSMVVADPPWGHVVALATLATAVGIAVLFRDLVLLAIGAIGLLLTLPRTMEQLFPGAVAAPVALLIGGSLLVATALYTSRRPTVPSSAEGRDYAVGSAGASMLIACGVVAVTTAAILVAGLA